MQIGRIIGATRTLGKSQGYLGLPVRDELVNCTVNGEGTAAMVTAWHPTPKELDALNVGAPVHVRILGSAHPPIMVEVGDAPEPFYRVTDGPPQWRRVVWHRFKLWAWPPDNAKATAGAKQRERR